jgi:Ca2+-binding RTX toxin-like protein
MTSASRRILMTCAASVMIASVFSVRSVNAAALRCFGKRPTIVGTENPESISGTPRADVILGLGGNDIITGGEGRDRICAGEGVDILRGNDGKDRMNGGPGDDSTIEGGRGNDVINGGDGQDLASYENAPNAVNVNLAKRRGRGQGKDRLLWIEEVAGSHFNDQLRGNVALLNRLFGSFGNDDLYGGGGTDDALTAEVATTTSLAVPTKAMVAMTSTETRATTP